MKINNNYWDKKLNELSNCDVKRDHNYWDKQSVKFLKKLALEMFALGAIEQFERDYKGLGLCTEPSWKNDEIEILSENKTIEELQKEIQNIEDGMDGIGVAEDEECTNRIKGLKIQIEKLKGNNKNEI
jgi:hypothetical protein